MVTRFILFAVVILFSYADFFHLQLPQIPLTHFLFTSPFLRRDDFREINYLHAL